MTKRREFYGATNTLVSCPFGQVLPTVVLSLFIHFRKISGLNNDGFQCFELSIPDCCSIMNLDDAVSAHSFLHYLWRVFVHMRRTAHTCSLFIYVSTYI